MRNFDLYRTLDRFADSIVGKERDLVHPAILVSRPLGSETGGISLNSIRIWRRDDGGLNPI